MSEVIGIVVTHGNLAAELIRTAETVIGQIGNCYALTNDKKSPQILREDIETTIEMSGGGPTIVFTDFSGGSCSHACMIVEAGRENVVVFSGVNLPMLLAFVNKRDELPFDELPAAILERSNKSIKILDRSKL